MIVLTRRNVLATLSGSAVLLCPALLNAQAVPDLAWDDISDEEPIGQKRLVTLEAGPAEIDVTDLAPGDVAVVARPTSDADYEGTGMIQYVGILRRTEAQVAYGAENDPEDAVRDPRFLVVNLLCPHKGKAVGITGDALAPFACTDQGRRHGSVFDASGDSFAGAAADDGDRLSVPDYSIQISGDGSDITSAIVQLA